MPTQALEYESWREAAACRGRDDVSFFPAPDSVTELYRAKVICGSCPVQQECLAYAIATSQPDGIWGGATRRERSAIRRRWSSLVS